MIGGTREVPIESIRLKRYRDGEEDYELLHYLATELGKERQAREIAGGPYAPTPESGLFKRMNESDVSDSNWKPPASSCSRCCRAPPTTLRCWARSATAR